MSSRRASSKQRNSRRQPDSGVSGCCIINKPPGCTSHDVVDQLRKKLGTRKIGHAGTLDPDATGVLVLGVGKGTKLLEFVTGTDKTYEGELVLGVETSTLDSAGQVTATHDMDVALADVEAAAKTLVGEIEQIPPMVSAVKVDGRRLHEIAREGGVVERPARQVRINSYEVTPTEDPLVYKMRVSCSSGTYIRTLAADTGSILGGGAHLRSLRRTSVGPFVLDDAATVEDAELLPVAELIRGMPVIEVDDEIALQIKNGRSLGASPGSGCLAVRGSDYELLAIYEVRDGQLKAAKVLA